MPRFRRDLMNAVLHGEVSHTVPYEYPVPPSKQAHVDAILGRTAAELFHTESWNQVSDPFYEGAQLWDNPEESYPQSPEDFERMRERFADWLPKELPPTARINPFGVVSYRPAGNCGHLRTLINPLRDVHSVTRVEKYPFPSAKEDWRWKGVEDRVCRWQADGYVVLGGMNIVLDYINFLFGMERSFMAMVEDDPVVEAVWKWMEDDRVHVAQRNARMGVDGLINGDHLATARGPLLSEQSFRRHVLPCYERIVGAAHAVIPDLPWVWHTDGDNDNYIHRELMAIGAHVFNPVEIEDARSLKERHGKQIVLWGTGDWQIMEKGTAADVRAMVADRVDIARRYGGLLLTSNATPDTPIENLIAFCRAAEELGV
jgi:hypothetical protein